MNIKKELKGKRLLVLGGSLWKEAIKEFADENEITIIATGNDHSAGIFEIADESYSIDSTNTEEMKKLINDKKIDGVYMGGSEPVIATACQYINELGLPCYCTKKQWDYLQNKANFKELCIKFGLPVVPKYNVTDKNINSDLKIEFPVITKPVDGCASSGFSVCHNIEELKIGYKIAKENSPSGNVIVEKYVNNTAVGVFYAFSNGKINYCVLEDKYPVKYLKQGSFVGGLYTFESQFAKEFRLMFENKLEKLFKEIGLKEGIVWLEVFKDKFNYYFNEVGYRMGGSVSAYPISYFTNINQIASDIYYCLTGNSKIFGFDSLIRKNTVNKSKYGIYCVHSKPGTIKSIDGVELLNRNNNIINCFFTKTINSNVKDTGSFMQIAALVHFVYDTKEELKSIIDNIHDTLKIYDENGNNMVNRMLDIDSINL